MIGQTISHYKILEKLGEGGMGVVNKGEYAKLKRTVALKFLPPELTCDAEAKKRFIQEAQAASALDHTNVCTIYEIDETKEGQTFIAMACYEGEILKDKIQKGPLKIDEAIDIAIQVAQGLKKAHEKGIVHLWAENYTGTLDDVFDIQESVSRSIVKSPKVQLGSAEKRILSDRPITDVRAYEFYLKARQEVYRFSEQGLDRALRHLEKGLEIIGENPLLLSCLGSTYFQYWNLGIRKDKDYLVKAKDCADRIFKTDPDSPHGRMILGLLKIFIDPQQAIKQFKTVLADNPYDDEALLWLCFSSVHLGKDVEATPLIERLMKTDPLNPIVKILPGLQLYYRGEWDRALEILESTYRSDTEYLVALWQCGRVLTSCGRHDEALSAFETVAEKGRSGFAEYSRLFEFALRGKKHDILQAANTELGQWARRDYMASLWMAECLAWVGEREKAMEWLESAVNLGYVNYPFLSQNDPFLVNIRSEPRFKKLMKRVKHEWENFEV